MSLADWSPIATHAISHGRTAFWFTEQDVYFATEPRPTYLIVLDDDSNTYRSSIVFWCGPYAGFDSRGWSTDINDALEFAHREDAELEIKSARDSINDKRREFVAVEEF